MVLKGQVKRSDQFLTAGIVLIVISRILRFFIENELALWIGRASTLLGIVCLCAGAILWWRNRHSNSAGDF